ncbi:8249_t:CDS:2 [Scutellospora calospora]|uniref:8249_t:CDS:1 n=1 Tax=Scutellospora calospora TaxID=85575 RepID=A0ACA9LI20_9GLOM|nr:8249_t:CDS:2 [Scutellospora calospora]
MNIEINFAYAKRPILKEVVEKKAIFDLFATINNDTKVYDISKDLSKDVSNYIDYETKINIKYCGSNTCRFLFFYRAPEQETRANFHFHTMVGLANKLNRTMVLTNVGFSRIGSCLHLPFNFYYSVSVLQKRFPNVKFISQAHFQQWTYERRNKPNVSHIYINTKPTNNPYSFEFVEPSIELLLNKQCFDQFNLKMDDTMIFKSVNIGPRTSWDTNNSNIIMLNYLTSQLNINYEVLLINHDLRYSLFINEKGVPPVTYANHLIRAANKVSKELDSYIGIHWRMETNVTKSLTKCANKLVKWINRIQNTTNITNVYFATDYPIDNTKKAQSSTFHDVTEQHHKAVAILNSSIHFNTWKSINSLEYLEELSELSEILQTEFRGAGVQGIIDKLILIYSNYFVTGPKGCCRLRSSFTGTVIQARMALEKAWDPRIKNIVSRW